MVSVSACRLLMVVVFLLLVARRVASLSLYQASTTASNPCEPLKHKGGVSLTRLPCCLYYNVAWVWRSKSGVNQLKVWGCFAIRQCGYSVIGETAPPYKSAQPIRQNGMCYKAATTENKIRVTLAFTACIIFKTPPAKYFKHGVWNIMQAVST